MVNWQKQKQTKPQTYPSVLHILCAKLLICFSWSFLNNQWTCLPGPVTKWQDVCLGLPKRVLALSDLFPLLVTQIPRPGYLLWVRIFDRWRMCSQALSVSPVSSAIISFFLHFSWTPLRISGTLCLLHDRWRHGSHQTGILLASHPNLFWQRPGTALAS